MSVAYAHEPFSDPRLSPQQNKAVEMLRNGFSRAEIAEELDISRAQLTSIWSKVRKRGVDIAFGEPGRPQYVPAKYMAALQGTLKTNRNIAERMGISEGTAKLRLWRYRRKQEGRS